MVIENHPNPDCGGSCIGFCYGNSEQRRELAGDFEKDEKGTGPFRKRGFAKYPAGQRMVPTSQKPTV